ncbi:MAG: diacylglycerol kinase family lipid kinase [Gammaproteobacteria bacterium]|nr:diacylglycerol kinase family lipid kinase [Gammaproteobacteria bacterium]
MKLLLIFNPHAAAGRAERLLPGVLRALESFADVEVRQTRRAGQAVDLVGEESIARYDGLIAAGGDGTLFEVVNGLFMHASEQRPPLGVIPVGTGNAFARDLGLLPGDWRKGIDIIRSARRRRVDAGRVETPIERYHFMNIVGAGLPVDAMRTAEHLKFVGNAAYSFATLWQAIRLQTYPFEIELDGRRLDRESMFVEISNTRYTGTSFLIAPEAELDDGLLDVTLVMKLSRPRLLRLFPTIYRGRHVDYPEVLTRKAREIRILGPEDLELAPDGEFRGRTPATITCLPGALDIFARRIRPKMRSG